MSRWITIAIIIAIGAILAFIWLPSLKPSTPPPFTEIRGAIDIGSGTTNLKVAQVDPQTNKIISIIFQKTVPVPYQKELAQSTNNEFSSSVMNEGIQSIKTLKELADQYQAKKVVAIATAAFRHAANGQMFAREIEKQTGVQVRIINQDEEGILGFRGALALTPIKPQEAVVWDIGGGSMQLTTLSNEGTYLIEHGQLASVPFKNAIIQDIEKKDLQSVSSPNPMNAEQVQAAIAFAKQKSLETDPFVKNKLASPDTHVLAVGNLFNIGIRSLVNNRETINQQELDKEIKSLVGKTDEQFGKELMPEVAVSNPLLVMGYMEGLNIKEIQFVKVNNADGALTYPPYWTKELKDPMPLTGNGD